jgi:LacI family transcriptional regulator
MGFSNLDLTDLLSPSLSVVRQPAFEMGQIATELLLQLIESKRPVRDFEKRVLPLQLLPRESSIKK